MGSKTKRWIPVARWTARLWSLGPILFALGEILFPHSEEGAVVPWTDWLALSIAFTSVVGLALAWRWERLGGWLSAVSLVAFLIVFVLTVDRIFPAVVIFLVGIGIPAALFLICAYAEGRSVGP
jgi:hypothetical protein